MQKERDINANHVKQIKPSKKQIHDIQSTLKKGGFGANFNQQNKLYNQAL
jgi:hypothetical protein